MHDKYEIVIGLEIHVQLKTKSKAFCGDDTSFGSEPNTQVSVISLGHPGTLPVPNKQHIESAVKLGLALGCTINKENRFDRKNYFYADLPKGYQITQDEQPICLGGGIVIKVENKEKYIKLTRIHMEEDAGKSIHDVSPKYSMIDLNRAGVPLLEIVSDPDLRSADEAYAYIGEIRRMVRWLDISDGNMEEGSLRCDCNISVRLKGTTKLGTRCEIKNVNSLRNAKRAIEYEANRQITILEAGGEIEQQTRSYDADKDNTDTILRDKEDAHDYRYFPEPDMPPVVLTETYIETLQKNLPKLPAAFFELLTLEHQLSEYDAKILTDDLETANFYLTLSKQTQNKKAAANLIINRIKSYLNENSLTLKDFNLGFDKMAAFIKMIDTGQVSSAIAYQRIFPVLVENPSKAPVQIAEELGLIQNADVDFLSQIVDEVLASYPDKVTIYKKGKKGLIGFFMGEVMKKSKGKAEPKSTNKLLREKLDA